MFSVKRFSNAADSAQGWQEATGTALDVVKAGYNLSPGIFADGHRCLQKCKGAGLLILDFDDGCDLETAAMLFAHCDGVIYTTQSHQRDKNGKTCDRFRVILKLSRQVNPTEYTSLYVDHLALGADPKAKDAAHFFWGAGADSTIIPLVGGTAIDVDTRLNTIPKGARNATLIEIAGKAARYGADIRKAVEDGAERCTEPLATREVESIIKSASRWTGDCLTNDAIAANFNARELYAFNERLAWLKWDGSRWRSVEATEVRQDIIRWAQSEITTAVAKPGTTELVKRLNAVRGNPDPVLHVLEAVAFVPYEKFIDQPWELNASNGIVDLTTGVLRAHCRSYALHQTAARYDESADKSTFENFLTEIMPDAELRHYVKVSLGYACSGGVTEEMFHLWLGGGKNGKSTLANILTGVLGDYVGELPAASLAVSHRSGDNQPHLATCLGKRLLFANEPSEGMRLDDSAVKELASRDRMQVCQKYGKPFTMSPSWLLVIRGNHRPSIRAVDDGIWRRVKEVPFLVRIDHPDKTIAERIIKDHGPAVLRWLVEGAVEYHKTGLPVCRCVEAASLAYRVSSDARQQWFNERVCPKAGNALVSRVVYQDFLDWCSLNKAGHVSQIAFGRWLGERVKYEPTARTWKDIDLVD